MRKKRTGCWGGGVIGAATEEVKRGAWSAEMAACIAEDVFESLDRKIVRIGELNTPVPYTVNLESYVIPQVEDIVEGVRSVAE